jgi:hypothetical protein
VIKEFKKAIAEKADHGKLERIQKLLMLENGDV